MRRWWIGAVAVLIVAACDDEAVQSPGDQGAGGLGAGGDGVGAIAADCNALCTRAIEATCEDQNCAPSCISQHDTDLACQAEFAASIACLAAHVDEVFYPCTERPAACMPLHDTWLACTGENGCGAVECPTVTEELCTCRSVCDGTLYEEMCVTDEDGTIDCICTQGGVVVAECPDAPLSCGGFFVGCCAALVT